MTTYKQIKAAQAQIEECAKNDCHLNNCDQCVTAERTEEERAELAKTYPVSLLTIYQDPSVLPQFRGWTQRVIDAAHFRTVEEAYIQRSEEMRDGHECLHYQVVDTITQKRISRPLPPLTEAQKARLKEIPF